MRILVIGGTGFIGRRVVDRLLAGGVEVAVFHRGGVGQESLGGDRHASGETAASGRDRHEDMTDPPRHVHGDRSSADDLREALEAFAPGVVVDMIPYTAPQVRRLVQAMAGVSDRLVVVSSSDVYRNYDGLRRKTSLPPDPAPLPEDAPLREIRHPYRGRGVPFEWADDYDKILVEEEAWASGLEVTVLRLSAVYGPGDRQHRFGPWVRRMVDDRPAILLDEAKAGWRWTRGYVEDVAAAVALAATDERAAGRIYNVGEAEAPTEREWVEAVADVLGWSGEIVTAPRDRLPGELREPFDFDYDLATDTTRIREELGYAEGVGRLEGLRATVAWQRERLGDPDPAVYAAEDALLGS